MGAESETLVFRTIDIRIRIEPSEDFFHGDTITVSLAMVLRKYVQRGFTTVWTPFRIHSEDEGRGTGFTSDHTLLVFIHGRSGSRRCNGSVWAPLAVTEGESSVSVAMGSLASANGRRLDRF